VDLSVVATAFSLLFLAEMGDKTQLIAMALAHRYRALPVLTGIFSAFLVLNLLAVFVGAALFRYVPQWTVLVAAGVLFLVFAWRSWAEGEEDGEEEVVARSGGHGALWAGFSLIFLAELGDKTQLVLIALAASSGDPWSTFVGGTLALWAVSALGVLVGSTLLRRVPRAWVHKGAALLFALFGVFALGQAVMGVDLPVTG
jgi:putative Ca2+/H+ antiporter (TMEM165/GDT1 family)